MNCLQCFKIELLDLPFAYSAYSTNRMRSYWKSFAFACVYPIIDLLLHLRYVLLFITAAHLDKQRQISRSAPGTDSARCSINMPVCASTGSVLGRCCQHRSSTGSVLAHNRISDLTSMVCRWRNLVSDWFLCFLLIHQNPLKEQIKLNVNIFVS